MIFTIVKELTEMRMKDTDRKKIHDHNSKKVIQQIFNKKAISRINIAQNIEVTKSTVTNLYREIFNRGFVHEKGEVESNGVGGRKPILIEINKNFGYVMNIRIVPGTIELMTNNIVGQRLYSKTVNVNTKIQTEIIDCVNTEITYANKLLKTQNGLLGIGFIITGIVKNNKIVSSPFLDLTEINFKKEFEDRYKVPVILENEANLLAIYIRDFCVPDSNNIIALSVNSGIGVGMLFDNQLYRGANGAAGEFGRTLDMASNQSEEKVENITSELAIQKRIAETKNKSFITKSGIFDLEKNNDKKTKEYLVKFAHGIAKSVYNLAQIFDPESIYISSVFTKEIPWIYEQIQQEIQQQGYGLDLRLINKPQLATFFGSTALVTRSILEMDGMVLNFDDSSINQKG